MSAYLTIDDPKVKVFLANKQVEKLFEIVAYVSFGIGSLYAFVGDDARGFVVGLIGGTIAIIIASLVGGSRNDVVVERLVSHHQQWVGRPATVMDYSAVTVIGIRHGEQSGLLFDYVTEKGFKGWCYAYQIALDPEAEKSIAQEFWCRVLTHKIIISLVVTAIIAIVFV